MAPTPKPPHLRRRRNPVQGGEWTSAPGVAPKRPATPRGLKAAAKAWWTAAWTSDLSVGWTASEIRLLERGARLADACAKPDASMACFTELRRIEDAMGLTRAGRMKLRVLPADDELPAAHGRTIADLAARRRRHFVDPAGTLDESSPRRHAVDRPRAIDTTPTPTHEDVA